jgi:endonuclease G
MLYVRIVSAFLVCLLLLPARPAGLSSAQPAYLEIHCKHFFFGCPQGTLPTNDLIIRDIYALSSNDETKFADWAAFRLTPQEVVGAAPRVGEGSLA